MSYRRYLTELDSDAKSRVYKQSDSFEADLRRDGSSPDPFVACAVGVSDVERLALLEELLRVHADHRRGRGERVDASDYLGRCQSDAEREIVREVFVGPGDLIPEDWAAIGELTDIVIEERLGAGTFGTVYRARQSAPNRVVAVKVFDDLVPEKFDSQHLHKTWRRVRRELNLAGRCRSVVTVHRFGKITVDGQPRYAAVMEYASGGTLEGRKGEYANPKAAAALTRSVAQGLAEVHKKGVIHRDLKPENVLFSADGAPLIADFGFARELGQASSLTLPTEALGTPGYMSPEQARGEAVDQRTDVFALGAMLYYLIVGRCVFPHDHYRSEIVRKDVAILNINAMEGVRRIDPGLDGIVMACLEKQPGWRIASAAELADQLDRYLSGKGGTRKLPGWPGRALRKFTLRPVVWSLVAILLIALGSSSVIYYWKTLTERALRREADAKAYIANIHAADAAIATKDFTAANRFLSATSPELRGIEWGYLNVRANNQWMTFAPATLASYSPDGKIVLTAADEVATLWDVKTGRELRPLRGHKGAISFIAFNRDGTRIITTSADHTARIWDTASGTVIASLEGHEAAVNFATFSPDGNRVATCSDDRTARLWDVCSGFQCSVLRGHANGITSAIFTPDGRNLLTAASRWEPHKSDSTVRVWDVAAGAQVRVLETGLHHVDALALTPDGNRLVVGGIGLQAGVWDLQSGNRVAAFDTLDYPIECITFSPDGNRIVAGTSDLLQHATPQVCVWDSTSGRLLKRFQGHTATVNSVQFDKSGNLLTASNDRTIRFWDVSSGKQLQTFAGHGGEVWSATLNPDGRSVLSVSKDKSARVWPVGIPTSLVLPDDAARAVFCRPAPDCRRLFATSMGGQAMIWDTKEGTPTLTLREKQPIIHMELSDDDTLLATTSMDGSVRLYDAKTGEPRFTFPGSGEPTFVASFSKDSARLLAASFDGTARVWDTHDGKQLLSIENQGGRIYSASFDPAGGRFITASGSSDPKVRIWDSTSGKALLTLVGHKQSVVHASFSPNGKLVATASQDQTVRIWDSKTGQTLRVLDGHSGVVEFAMFTRKGDRIITCSHDGSARIWDVSSGEELLTISESKLGAFDSATESPDGEQIVLTTTGQGVEVIHCVAPEQLRQRQ